MTQVGVSNWANFGEDGAEVANPVFPYRLRFQVSPTPLPLLAAHWRGSLLRRVCEAVHRGPQVHPSGLGPLQHPGLGPAGGVGRARGSDWEPRAQVLFLFRNSSREESLKCRSEMITSLWGDQRLLIRHDDEARDLVLKPEWNQYTPQFGPYFENDPTQSSKCPMYDLK